MSTIRGKPRKRTQSVASTSNKAGTPHDHWRAQAHAAAGTGPEVRHHSAVGYAGTPPSVAPL